MKTTEELARLVFASAEMELSELKECNPEAIRDMVTEIKKYSKELVKDVLKKASEAARVFDDGHMTRMGDWDENWKVIPESILNAYPETLII